MKLLTVLLSVVMLSGCVTAGPGPMTQQEKCWLIVVGLMLTTCVLAAQHSRGRTRTVLYVVGVGLVAGMLLA